MNNAQRGKAFSVTAILTAAALFGSWLLAPTPAKALEDASQLLSGGILGMTTGQTYFSAPGVPAISTGQIKGESSIQIRMPAGQVRNLRVRLTSVTTPSAGVLTVVVRKNAANTTLTCELTKAGECASNAIISFADNDKLSVRVINNFTGSGLMGLTYTLLFN
jgi:hypothetical protein